MTALSDDLLRVAEAHALNRTGENRLRLWRSGLRCAVHAADKIVDLRTIAHSAKRLFNQAKVLGETDLDRGIGKIASGLADEIDRVGSSTGKRFLQSARRLPTIELCPNLGGAQAHHQ